MQLFQARDFRRGDLAAPIGTGGKTISMFRLAKALSENSRNLLWRSPVTQTGAR